ncbi:hypothetical protein PG984_014355 [Apiospora sp. TS-2023a]
MAVLDKVIAIGAITNVEVPQGRRALQEAPLENIDEAKRFFSKCGQRFDSTSKLDCEDARLLQKACNYPENVQVRAMA